MSYFEIGICNSKFEANIGTLWRSAYQLGASGIFTIGKRYVLQKSDTFKAYRHIPLRHYIDIDEFILCMPTGSELIGIEFNGIPLSEFTHPKRAIYLLGAEDYGLSQEIIARCQSIVSLEGIKQLSYNVSVAGSIVMYDRIFGVR